MTKKMPLLLALLSVLATEHSALAVPCASATKNLMCVDGECPKGQGCSLTVKVFPPESKCECKKVKTGRMAEENDPAVQEGDVLVDSLVEFIDGGGE